MYPRPPFGLPVQQHIDVPSKDASPHLSCSLTQSAWYLSQLLLHTRTRPSVWSMQHRDSSLNTYDTSSLDAIPRGMFLGPYRTLVSVTLGQDGADVWATST
ncbi:hypothetical protein ElyMa_001953600 [Elysia marginata]|uniref:Uncharacterized protein n=1 Tax=Elysia marginata TaxID=1093978 RepID=A0AAV4EYC3_9GAST|nr:hypothetical protein ElyMa_001953600 [Elysia marginata]